MDANVVLGLALEFAVRANMPALAEACAMQMQCATPSPDLPLSARLYHIARDLKQVRDCGNN